MSKLQSKLQSNTGASLSVALLFFLMCAVVGSIILVSATSAAGRIADTKETDQSYYAVTSAASVLKDDLQSQSMYLEKRTRSGASNYSILDSSQNSKSRSSYSFLEELLYCKANRITASADTLQMTVDGYPDLTVLATFTMNSDYTMEVVIKNQTDEGESPSMISLTCTPTITSRSTDANGTEIIQLSDYEVLIHQ